MKHLLQFVALIALCASSEAFAQKNNWVICDMTVTVNKIVARQVVGTILTRKATADAECPAVGQTLAFEPETADYQQTLPKKRWPKVKQIAKVRYRYLDGNCKDAGPCRIEHHSIIP